MQNNPFKQLKGFSVLAAEKPVETKDRPVAEPPPAAEPADFAEEMGKLGVRRLNKGPEPVEKEPPAPRELVKPAPPATDEELFVSALGQLDTVFSDRYPEDEESPAAVPRRMKLLRQGKLTPEATLDLHGLHREEAREKVGFFFDDAIYHGFKTVLVVTGWGRGAGGESVLRGEIERYLADEGKARVVEWGRAPRKLGGDGALVVFLRSADKMI